MVAQLLAALVVLAMAGYGLLVWRASEAMWRDETGRKG